MGHGVPDIVPKAHLKRGIREVQEAEGKVGKAEVLGLLLPGQGMGETLGDSGLLWHPVNAVTQVLLSHGTGQLLCYALRAVALATVHWQSTPGTPCAVENMEMSEIFPSLGF